MPVPLSQAGLLSALVYLRCFADFLPYSLPAEPPVDFAQEAVLRLPAVPVLPEVPQPEASVPLPEPFRLWLPSQFGL